MKKIIKTFAIIAFVLVLGLGFSCKGKKGGDDDGGDTPKDGSYSITYELNGGALAGDYAKTYDGTKNVLLPTPTKANATFVNWFANAEFTGDPVSVIKKGETGNKTFYAKWSEGGGSTSAKWELNTIGWDGKGMNIVIKVLPVTEYDPFVTGYTGEHAVIKQAHQRQVESAYGINIVYSAWDNEAPWGPERVAFIKENTQGNGFKSNNVYIITIASQWIPTLVKGNCLAELGNTNTETGVMYTSEFGGKPFEFDSTVAEAMSVQNKVYGYSLGAARPDYFLYYNADLAASINMEDPAELWFKGEWTWSKFDAWVREAQTRLPSGSYAIDCGYAEFSIGAVAAQGNKMVNAKSGTIMFTKQAVTSVFDKMKAYYQGGYWDTKHGVQDVATNFVNGTTIIHTGEIWFLKESTRFDPGQIKFEIGVVPYPADDSNNTMTPITEPYTYTDTSGNEVEVTEPIKTRKEETLKTASGDAIYGIDLSESTFQMPYTGTSNYSIVKTENGANGINSDILFYILHDLIGGLGDDPTEIKQTEDEAYRTFLGKKLDSAIYVDVIMSVQDSSLSYYELMEVLSMTVGGGSHFGPNAYWPLASSIMTSSDTPATLLKQVEDVYKAALAELGY